MGLTVKEGSTIVPVPEGVHQAVCYALYDLGTQFSEKWGKSAHQCLIVWELPEERIEVEKGGERLNLPRVISKKYTMSLNQKAALRKDLQSWRGRDFTPEELEGFDITKLLGVNCMIQIIHKKVDNKVYANITAITPLYKTLKVLKPENEPRYFSMSESMDIPEDMPDWIKETIENSAEWQGRYREEPEIGPVNYGNDDVPF